MIRVDQVEVNKQDMTEAASLSPVFLTVEVYIGCSIWMHLSRLIWTFLGLNSIVVLNTTTSIDV